MKLVLLHVNSAISKRMRRPNDRGHRGDESSSEAIEQGDPIRET